MKNSSDKDSNLCKEEHNFKILALIDLILWQYCI